MSELRQKIAKYLELKGIEETLSMSIDLEEIILKHRASEIKECPRCLSTRKSTYLLGFHHICHDCGHKY